MQQKYYLLVTALVVRIFIDFLKLFIFIAACGIVASKGLIFSSVVKIRRVWNIKTGDVT